MADWTAPADETAGFSRSRRPSQKINFLGVVPEFRSSSRNTYGQPVPPSSVDSRGGGAARGQLRLRVLNSLPPTHQQYLFEKMRALCRNYLRTKRVPASEVTPEELLSEIWLKLLATVSLDDEMEEFTSAVPADSSVDLFAPERDGRVVWLIEEIGGFAAIAHRYEDILRQRYGRVRPEGGRPILQLDDEDEADEIGPKPDRALQWADAHRVWRGLLIRANVQFQQRDDVSMLLRLMADHPDILEDSSTNQWPIAKMVALLNERFPPPSWTVDRVDNAKRRLVNWIKRLMRESGLDATDLEDLLARVARQEEVSKRVSLTGYHHPNVTS